MRFLTWRGCSWTSKPATLAVPEEGGRKQVSTRMVVVFPAPLGPRKPTICPLSTSKEMLSTATVRAYRLVRPSTLIICIVSQPMRTRLRGAAAVKRLKFHHKNRGGGLSNGGELRGGVASSEL